MKILFVSGTFNDEGGKKSGLMEKLSESLKTKADVDVFNGGFYDDLKEIIKQTVYYDTIFWLCNVDNTKEKHRNIKEINPKALLVNSKRNDNEKYTMQELINRSLEQKANLTIEFSKEAQGFKMRLFDPLGNLWYEGFDIDSLSEKMFNRLVFLKSITRQGTIQDVNENIENYKVNDSEVIEFVDIVKNYAQVFSDVIKPAKDVKRFLGNASIRIDNFRCTKGFPTFKKNGLIYVSRRNVNKENLSIDDFVPVYFDKDKNIKYIGLNKPSVDTPIQIRLYKFLPNINFMIHSHCYVEGAPFTKINIPCGGLEEVDEVIDTLKRNYDTLDQDFYVINLIGHGNIVMAKDVRLLKNLKFYGRSIPERIKYE